MTCDARHTKVLLARILTCLAVLSCAAPAAAQARVGSTAQRGPVSGFVFAGPGSRLDARCDAYDPKTFRCLRQSWTTPRQMPHVGGGIERLLLKAVGVSVEGGVVFLNGYVGGMLSANGTYYVGDASAATSRWVPFVTGGYTLDPDMNHGLNAGGGIAWWGRTRGIRLEMRAQVFREIRIFEFRAGLAFGRASHTR